MNENNAVEVSFGLDEFLTYGAITTALIWVVWAAAWAYESYRDRRYWQQVAEAVRKLQKHSNEDEK